MIWPQSITLYGEDGFGPNPEMTDEEICALPATEVEVVPADLAWKLADALRSGSEEDREAALADYDEEVT